MWKFFVEVLGLMTWTSAFPIQILLTDQYGRQFLMPFYATQQQHQPQLERSDNIQNPEYSSEFGRRTEGGFQPSAGHYGEDDQQKYSSQLKSYDHDSLNDQPSSDDYTYDHHQGNEHNYEQDHNYDHDHGFDGENHVPVSEHVEVTKPVTVPVFKEIGKSNFEIRQCLLVSFLFYFLFLEGVPVPHEVKIHVPHPVVVNVPQPYPVGVPVGQPVPIQVIKTIAVPVEKKVPYPVEKHIPVPIEKPVPITVERHIPVPVEKPYPIKIPVYKTIHHHTKSYHG